MAWQTTWTTELDGEGRGGRRCIYRGLGRTADSGSRMDAQPDRSCRESITKRDELALLGGLSGAHNSLPAPA